MNRPLSKILYTTLTAAAAFAVACSSDAPVTAEPGAEMRFDATGSSRATLTTGLDYEDSRFAVYGDMNGATGPQSGLVVFNGIPVSYTDSKWTYADPQYWIPDYEYSFVAVHPAGTRGLSDTQGISGSAYSAGSLSFTFTLPGNYKETPDILTATHRRLCQDKPFADEKPDVVMLNFVHALSRINFKVTNDGAAETVKVTGIELQGVSKSGSLSVTPATLNQGSTRTDDYDLAWTASQNKETLTAGIDVDVPDAGTQPLFPDSDALFMIPQPDNKSIITKINYTLIYKNGKTEERTLAAETPIGGWESGTVYNYTLTLSAESKSITLTVTVDDWKQGPDSGVTVPRK